MVKEKEEEKVPVHVLTRGQKWQPYFEWAYTKLRRGSLRGRSFIFRVWLTAFKQRERERTGKGILYIYAIIMGTGVSRQEPQVHVVVVQSKDDGTIEAEHVRPSGHSNTSNTNVNNRSK